EHDRGLDEARAAAVDRLGQGEPLQAELVRHRRPELAVEAVAVLQEVVACRAACVASEKDPHRGAEVLLLPAEGELDVCAFPIEVVESRDRCVSCGSDRCHAGLHMSLTSTSN